MAAWVTSTHLDRRIDDQTKAEREQYSADLQSLLAKLTVTDQLQQHSYVSLRVCFSGHQERIHQGEDTEVQ